MASVAITNVCKAFVVCTLAQVEFKAIFKEQRALETGDSIALRPTLDHVHQFDASSGARLSEA